MSSNGHRQNSKKRLDDRVRRAGGKSSPRTGKLGVGRGHARRNGHPDVTQAVILAGGKGTRLAPYTSVLPKPLMPIGERAILEVVVEQLTRQGFKNITFCVGHLSHLIRAVFDHSRNLGARISYVQEEEALGTAGPLRLVDGLSDTFLVMNGDVLTHLDYREVVHHHVARGNLLTIAAQKRVVKVDYGVLHVQTDGDTSRVQGYVEKPEIVSTVSMGVYVLDRSALSFIPDGAYFDIPDLIRALLAANKPIGAYAYDGLWFDIGREDDYRQAVTAWAAGDADLLH